MPEKILEDRATRLQDWRLRILSPDEAKALSDYLKHECKKMPLAGYFASFLYMASQHGHA